MKDQRHEKIVELVRECGQLVKEAGGLVSDINDRELAYDRQCSVVARNAVVQTIHLGT